MVSTFRIKNLRVASKMIKDHGIEKAQELAWQGVLGNSVLIDLYPEHGEKIQESWSEVLVCLENLKKKGK